MNPEIVSSDSTTTEVERPEVLEVNNNETQLLLPAKSSADSSTAQWQQYGEQIAAFLQGLPSYVANFFGKNRGPLGSIGLIVAVLITVKLILAQRVCASRITGFQVVAVEHALVRQDVKMPAIDERRRHV